MLQRARSAASLPAAVGLPRQGSYPYNPYQQQQQTGQPSRAPPTPARNLDTTDLQRQLGALVREAPELQAQVSLSGQQCFPKKLRDAC